MAEMTRNGLELRWSSLNPAERRLYLGSIGCLTLGGALVGFLAGLRGDGGEVSVPLALLPLAPLALGLWLWTRLSRRQDEFHQRMGALAARVAYWSTLAVAIPVGLVEGLAGVQLVPVWGIALVTVLSGGLGWMLAARRFLGGEG